MRSIPDGFASGPLAEIDGRLADIAAEQHVSILLAIESGSRAWGFPSPDSDYDCRFIFVRREKDYLSPWQKRDVIETPLVDDIDLNGWELGKAIKLLLKGNAVVIEWLNSPIVYQGDPTFRPAMLDLAHRFTSRAAIARHYLHLGERQRRTYFRDDEPFAIKKLFYALRPAAALRWLRLHPHEPVPPMHFPTLIEQSEVSPDLRNLIDDLIARKAETRELGSALLPKSVANFVAHEFQLAHESGREPLRLSEKAKRTAEELFRSVIKSAGSTPPHSGCIDPA